MVSLPTLMVRSALARVSNHELLILTSPFETRSKTTAPQGEA